MDIDHQQPPDESTTTTTGTDDHTETFSQPCDFPLFTTNSPVEAYKLHPEYLSDDRYMFDRSHSQQTRIEVLDALGLAKTISPQNYECTMAYISKHKHLDIDKLKQIATQTPPSNTGAHNELGHAPHHHNHHE
jgi:hypothetical protein